MRKLRGLTKDGEWVYGWYLFSDDKHYIVDCCGVTSTALVLAHSISNLPGYHEVIPKTVGQCTGLKDKNGKGKEIYQDDIMGLYSGTKYFAYWDNDWGQWWGRPIKESKGSFARPLNELLDNFYREIIGNVHQNPELLEKK